MVFSDIPLELLSHICELLTHVEVSHFILVSQTCCSVGLPALYRSISLVGPVQVYACCRTLTTSAHDVAGMVRSFTVTQEGLGLEGLDRDEAEQSRSSLWRAIGSMNALRHFRYHLHTEFFNPSLLVALSGLQSLDSISILFDDSVWRRHEWDIDALSICNSTFPLLEFLEFDTHYTSPFDPRMESYLMDMLTNNAQGLKSISLLGSDGGRFIRHSNLWPVLQSLTLDSKFVQPELLSQTPDLRTLNIIVIHAGPVPLMPSGIVPHLEVYSGPSASLGSSKLLEGRPLRSISLDGATSDPCGSGWVIPPHPADWEVVASVLERLSTSTSPIRELSLYLGDLPAGDWVPFITPLRTIHTLTICLGGDWHVGLLHDFGREVLANLPELHTFLLSDISHFAWDDNDYGRFEDAHNKRVQKRVLDSWEKEGYSKSLRKVSFTALFSWNKLNGVWVSEEFPKDPKMYRNYEE